MIITCTNGQKIQFECRGINFWRVSIVRPSLFPTEYLYCNRREAANIKKMILGLTIN